jgi:phosphopantothenoylcysteine decarboxylase/phosphopantothenate--cysteine ligase
VVLAPAMNDRMWAHAQVQRNVHHLAALGYAIIPPDEGALAIGEGSGAGRLPAPETLVAYVGRALEEPTLSAVHLVVTAGPTREPVDPVRFLSNRSSGRMGIAIAEAAWRRGARVTLIAGPLEHPVAAPVARVDVETTSDMRDAVAAALPNADALIMAAAPADFTAATVAEHKLKKEDGPPLLSLVATPDILRTTRDRRPRHAVIVGFALETQQLLASARRKLASKELDFIVANSVGEPDAGFGSETNRVTIVGPGDAVVEVPLQSKREVAEVILDHVHSRLHERRELASERSRGSTTS